MGAQIKFGSIHYQILYSESNLLGTGSNEPILIVYNKSGKPIIKTSVAIRQAQENTQSLTWFQELELSALTPHSPDVMQTT